MLYFISRQPWHHGIYIICSIYTSYFCSRTIYELIYKRNAYFIIRVFLLVVYASREQAWNEVEPHRIELNAELHFKWSIFTCKRAKYHSETEQLFVIACSDNFYLSNSCWMKVLAVNFIVAQTHTPSNIDGILSFCGTINMDVDVCVWWLLSVGWDCDTLSSPVARSKECPRQVYEHKKELWGGFLLKLRSTLTLCKSWNYVSGILAYCIWTMLLKFHAEPCT